MAAEILFIDASLVVIAKPPGISLATRRGEPHAAAARLLAALPPAEVAAHGLAAEQLWLAHRLDVTTSGVVLLARDADAHRTLTKLITGRLIDKTYLALVWGRPRPAEGSWTWSLGPDRRDRRRMRVDPAGRPARSDYRVLARTPHVSLLQLVPFTGRTHQLRVHCAHAGHPIVGDDLYGGPRERGVREARLRAALQPNRALLHAWRIVLPPPFGPDGLVVTAPVPPDLDVVLAAVGIARPDLP